VLEALLALAAVRAERGNRKEARALVDEARSILAGLEGAGDYPRRVEALASRLRPAGRRVGYGQVLTMRELSVLRLLQQGRGRGEIGRELGMSPNTVKTHTRAIYRKLGVSSWNEAVAEARRLGVL
jgi:LuxR family maltose regulon positive regulatory protein